MNTSRYQETDIFFVRQLASHVVYNLAKYIHGDQHIGGIAGRKEGKTANAYNHSIVASRYQVVKIHFKMVT